MKALCKQCGVEFDDDYKGVGGRKLYCSERCSKAYRNGRYYLRHKSKWLHINDKKEVKDAGVYV
jgi:transposase-like protein